MRSVIIACLLTDLSGNCRGNAEDTANQRIGVKSEARRKYESREVKEVVKNVDDEVSKKCRLII